MKCIAISALLLFSGCGHADDSDIRSELRAESAKFGLAIAAGVSNRIVIIPFDGSERYFKTEHTRQLKLFGASGSMVLWLYRPSFLESSQFFIDSIRGERIADIHPRVSEFSPVALSEASRRLAFLGRSYGKDKPNGLHWAAFNFSRVNFVAQADGNCDWSPDGNALVYENKGQIYIFDVASSSSRRLTRGHDPAWSPNGKWIAFRSVDERASLVSIEGKSVNWAVGTHNPTSPIRWSPDGRYVSFSEAIPSLQIPFITADYGVSVSRISDGQSIIVKKFGAYGTSSFFWIIDYRSFCGGCMPGTPFN